MQLSQVLPEALRDSRAVKVLERSLAQNRLGHGILLHGESLIQLEEIVRAIASVLFETQRDPFEHPDCFILRPQGKARMIKIGSESERKEGMLRGSQPTSCIETGSSIRSQAAFWMLWRVSRIAASLAIISVTLRPEP